MKKNQSLLLYFFIIIFIFLCLFITMRLLELKESNTSLPVIQGVIIENKDIVTVHNQPSKNSHVVTILKNEDIVEVLDSTMLESNNWYEVRSEEEQGWILAEFLEIIKSELYIPSN